MPGAKMDSESDPTEVVPQPEPQPDYAPGSRPRLGTPFPQRLPLTTTSGFILGMAMGTTKGSTKTGFRFRAENAHRFPTSSTGWYQYHKSKFYKSALGGLKEGIKMGSILGGSAMAFCVFEETVDNARNGQRDFLSTVTAGLSLSGMFSLVARHDIYTAARTVKLGLKMGLTYGLLQDGISTMKGSPPRYIKFALGYGGGQANNDGDSAMV